MSDMYINFVLAFVEGLVLIASPCILPILPLILSGSIDGNKKRPFGIILGFILAFSLFTFFSKKIVAQLGIDLDIIRNMAFGLLAVIAIIMISSTLSEKFSHLTRKLGNVGSNAAFNKQESGFFGGIIFGSLIALIWTPCAGPILAAVIVQTVLQKTTLQSFLTLLFFSLGVGLPMFLIAIFGRTLIAKFSFLQKHTTLLRQFLGLIILLSVIYMVFGNMAIGSTTNIETKNNVALENALSSPYPAPAMDGITDWINSQPLKLSDLKGKVVLIDFWTYSCINCIRSLPYIKSWYDKYHDKGLVIIGVHTPEFDFEKKRSNVESAVKKFKITYPVALDNNYKTWQNFNNQYWPAHYLIDKNGKVVYQHFGEGEYDVTENNIRFLLNINESIEKTPLKENLADLISTQTPETYLGFSRASNFASNENMTENAKAQYTFPTHLDPNNWALQGEWFVANDNIIAGKNAAIRINFHAKQVYVVMGSDKPVAVKVLLDGKPLDVDKGNDVQNSEVKVSSHRLYEVVAFDKIQSGILELSIPAEGVEVYTFTFGNK